MHEWHEVRREEYLTAEALKRIADLGLFGEGGIYHEGSEPQCKDHE